jgi:hypothetical protein
MSSTESSKPCGDDAERSDALGNRLCLIVVG